MSLASLEREIFWEMKVLLGKPKMKKSNFTEWRTTEFTPPKDEKIIFCPVLKVWAAYKD